MLGPSPEEPASAGKAVWLKGSDEGASRFCVPTMWGALPQMVHKIGAPNGCSQSHLDPPGTN